MQGKKVSLSNKKIILIGSTIFVLLVIAIGFAFFSADTSNSNHETVLTQTATVSLKFNDGDNGISGTLNLSESISLPKVRYFHFLWKRDRNRSLHYRIRHF